VVCAFNKVLRINVEAPRTFSAQRRGASRAVTIGSAEYGLVSR
jgi:hypothetical protein